MESNKRSNATGLPSIDVEPSVLTHPRQLLLTKMFGTKFEPNADEPELNRHVVIEQFTEDDLEGSDSHRSERQRWFSRALMLALVLGGTYVALSVIIAH